MNKRSKNQIALDLGEDFSNRQRIPRSRKAGAIAKAPEQAFKDTDRTGPNDLIRSADQTGTK